VAEEFAGVVPLEGGGELVEEGDEFGGGRRWQLEGQAGERQVVGLEHGSALLAGAAGPGLAGGALLRFLEAIALAFEGDDLGAVQQAIDEGDHAGGVGEHLVPFAEGLVGAEEDGALQLVAAGDDLEQQIGIAGVVGQIADLVDGEDRGAGIAAEPAGERDGGVLVTCVES